MQLASGNTHTHSTPPPPRTCAAQCMLFTWHSVSSVTVAQITFFFFSSFFWSHQMLFPNWDICSFLNKHSLLFCFNAFVQVVSYTFKAPLPILRMNFWYLSQWHAGSLGRRGVGRKHSFVTFVDVHVVNTSAMADFSLPMWGHWMQSWEEMGNNPPLQSVFNILIQ